MDTIILDNLLRMRRNEATADLQRMMAMGRAAREDSNKGIGEWSVEFLYVNHTT
jgi:hypothetical protein